MNRHAVGDRGGVVAGVHRSLTRIDVLMCVVPVALFLSIVSFV